MNGLSQISIHKDGEHIANVPTPLSANKPVGVPMKVWQVIYWWSKGADYAPKYKGFTWGWHK